MANTSIIIQICHYAPPIWYSQNGIFLNRVTLFSINKGLFNYSLCHTFILLFLRSNPTPKGYVEALFLKNIAYILDLYKSPI